MTKTLEGITERIGQGRFDEASGELQALPETQENRVQRHFLKGYLLERQHDLVGALEVYTKVREMDPDHREATFRAAMLADHLGDEDAAIELYEICIAEPPSPVNAMINLAVLYEDIGRFDEAACLLEGVLDKFPNHRRAVPYLKSVDASFTMYYDEKSQRDRERRDAVLDMPVNEFELSVRSRNCLKQMDVHTLGDLLKITEAELLSYKNFGETSLNEIKAMLAQKKLRLGQGMQSLTDDVPGAEQPANADGDTATAMLRPVAELELSVRSRRCLQRLGITTIGELVARTEAEMIAMKNFGLTSLNEIKRQLAQFNLMLAPSK